MDSSFSIDSPPPPPKWPEIMTPQQVADFLKVKLPTVYSWVHKAEITKFPYHKLGNLLRFYKHEIIEWFNNKKGN